MSNRDDNCIQTLVQAGIHLDQAQDKLDDVQRRMGEYRDKGASEADAIKNATEDALKEESLAIQQKRLSSLQDLHKRMDMWNGVKGDIDTQGFSAKSVYEAIRTKLVGTNRIVEGGRVSMDADMQASKNHMLGGYLREMAETKLSKVAFNGGQDEDIAKEMSQLRKGAQTGITKNPIAKQLAEVYTKYAELGKQTVNKAGAFINDLHDYIARNEHNWEKISDAGEEKWTRDISGWLDKGKTFEGMDSQRIQQFLHNTYHALVSGEFFQGGAIGMEARTAPLGSMAERISRERVLHFSDDGWYKYFKQYGTSNSLAESIQNTLGKSARDATLLRYFGSNPNQEFTNLLTRVRQEYSETNPEEIRKFQEGSTLLPPLQKQLQNRFDEISGLNSQPKNKLVQSIGMAARTFENITKLGFVPFAHGSIAVTRALDAHHWGDSALGHIADSLTALFTRGHANTEEGREILDLIGARNDGFISHIVGPYNEGFTGAAATLNNLYMKSTGLTYVMGAERTSHEWMLSKFLGGNLSKDFDKLHPRTASTLQNYGIDKGAWDMLKGVENPTLHQGKTFLTPDMADRVNAPDAVKEELARKLSSMFSDSSRRAMNIPGAEVKALLYRDLPFGGPLGRAVLQFKQWPTELMLNAFGREIHDNPTTGQKMLGLFSLVGGLTASGYIRLALRDMGHGQQPPALNGQTILLAAQEGGAGLMLADTFAGLMRQHQYDEAVASLFGPVAKDTYDFGKIFTKANKGSNLEEFGLKHIPFQNLWYLNLLTNYYFLWGLHETVHPGWSERYENSIQQETGNKPFIGPVH